MNDNVGCHTLTSTNKFSNFEYTPLDMENPDNGTSVLFTGGDNVPGSSRLYAF